MARRIICGFQTGADQAGARAAKRKGYLTGGMMPKGFLTEEGPRPEFAELYGAIESRHAGYEHRTRWNVMKSDATIIFARTRADYSIIDGGSFLTRAICDAMGKSVRVLDLTKLHPSEYWTEASSVWGFFEAFDIVNVAGNAESRVLGIGAMVEQFLVDALVQFTPAIVAPETPLPSQET